jgi:hypothetical protein
MNNMSHYKPPGKFYFTLALILATTLGRTEHAVAQKDSLVQKTGMLCLLTDIAGAGDKTVYFLVMA